MRAVLRHKNCPLKFRTMKSVGTYGKAKLGKASFNIVSGEDLLYELGTNLYPEDPFNYPEDPFKH